MLFMNSFSSDFPILLRSPSCLFFTLLISHPSPYALHHYPPPVSDSSSESVWTTHGGDSSPGPQEGSHLLLPQTIQGPYEVNHILFGVINALTLILYHRVNTLVASNRSNIRLYSAYYNNKNFCAFSTIANSETWQHISFKASKELSMFYTASIQYW